MFIPYGLLVCCRVRRFGRTDVSCCVWLVGVQGAAAPWRKYCPGESPNSPENKQLGLRTQLFAAWCRLFCASFINPADEWRIRRFAVLLAAEFGDSAGQMKMLGVEFGDSAGQMKALGVEFGNSAGLMVGVGLSVGIQGAAAPWRKYCPGESPNSPENKQLGLRTQHFAAWCELFSESFLILWTIGEFGDSPSCLLPNSEIRQDNTSLAPYYSEIRQDK